jgi:hypothetical protein
MQIKLLSKLRNRASKLYTLEPGYPFHKVMYHKNKKESELMCEFADIERALKFKNAYRRVYILSEVTLMRVRKCRKIFR